MRAKSYGCVATRHLLLAPDHGFTIGREEFESLSLAISVAQAQADVLAVLAATGNVTSLLKDSLSGMLANMVEQLEDAHTRLHAAVSHNPKETTRQITTETSAACANSPAKSPASRRCCTGFTNVKLKSAIGTTHWC